jgi:GNAT superfamily N-acetyltransferase
MLATAVARCYNAFMLHGEQAKSAGTFARVVGWLRRRWEVGLAALKRLSGVPWVASFRTRRGERVRVRHIRPDDTTLLVDLFDHLSPRSRYLRFFTPLTNISRERVQQEAQQLAAINPERQGALVGIVRGPHGPAIIGVARWSQQPTQPNVAEVAIVVRDDYQGQGVGRHLFALLGEVARARGITTMTATTVAENHVVLRALHRSGLPFRTSTHRGETTIEIML